MKNDLTLRIILENPPVGVEFGLQKGSGGNYETIQKQKGNEKNLLFELNVKIKSADINTPVFLGLLVQGTPNNRFVYIDIGTYAGQKDSPWGRRLKIPLRGITAEMINLSLSDPQLVIETVVSGIGKDGGPNCGTIKPFNGWKLSKTCNSNLKI